MRPDGWRAGAVAATLPLAVLVAIVVVGAITLALVRALTAPFGFFTEQAVVLATLALMGLLGLMGYALACRRVMARIHAWQLTDQRAAPAAAMVTLSLTALIVVLPVLLATLLPQHPAP
jgi:hypothetical protein